MTFLIDHWLDITTTVLGLAYILLEYRASVWMWVVGAAMQLLGIVLYYQKGLYADCGMEFYYLAVTAYGFWKWNKKNTETLELSENSLNAENALPIRHFPKHQVAEWVAATLVIWLAIYQVLIHFTNSTVPVADAFTTALSIVGIWALAHKYLEQWFVWIVVDVVTCWLYWQKDIPFKASLYALYVVIAVFGFFRWRRQMLAASSLKP
jgi:nicotinamide mononucleotide transporter